MTTQELTKEVLAMSAKVAGIESTLHEANTRLEAMEREVKEQGKLLQSIDRLAMGLTRLDEKMGDLSCKIDTFGSRINLIELKPAEKHGVQGVGVCGAGRVRVSRGETDRGCLSVRY
jgi:predicted RNase H-like nuclease (RuvC/YqgF family)